MPLLLQTYGHIFVMTLCLKTVPENSFFLSFERKKFLENKLFLERIWNVLITFRKMLCVMIKNMENIYILHKYINVLW